jgi:hypothetical protein
VGTKSENTFSTPFSGRVATHWESWRRDCVSTMCASSTRRVCLERHHGHLGLHGHLVQSTRWRYGGGEPTCTLGDCPHLTDHCIEWSRDHCELFLTKTSKSIKAVWSIHSASNQIRDDAALEPGAAFVHVRFVTSVRQSHHRTGCWPMSFDLFHFLFKNGFSHLHTAFPADFRIVTTRPRWTRGPSGARRRGTPPTVAVFFNMNGESHTNFLLSATCLFGVMTGLISSKAEEDSSCLPL